MTFLNLSGYHFKPLENLPAVKALLLEKAEELSVKGTILLSPEGINLFLSGPENECTVLLNTVCENLNITQSDLELKPSWSDSIAFNRFLVRLKKEIIAFDSLYNHDHSAPYVSPTELEQWLSEDPENVVMLDTRNLYESRFGSFVNAVIPPIDTFKEFKPFCDTIDHLKDKKIVTFCTGGIRCEKAATFMKEKGFQNVFQLKGGILRYFEETQSQHYEGECFVFDKRVSLKPNLEISDKKVCYACRAPLTTEECAHEHYIEGVSCPYCFKKELS